MSRGDCRSLFCQLTNQLRISRLTEKQPLSSPSAHLPPLKEKNTDEGVEQREARPEKRSCAHKLVLWHPLIKSGMAGGWPDSQRKSILNKLETAGVWRGDWAVRETILTKPRLTTVMESAHCDPKS